MALSKAKVREILSEAGVDSDHMIKAVDAIIDGNVTSIEALREDVAKYKAEAEKLPAVQKELDELKAKINENSTDPYEPKYNELKAEFDKFKEGIEAKETATKKRNAYRDLLKEAGIAEKRIDAILKVTDISALELTDEGKIKDADKKSEAVKTEWAEFIETQGTKGADTPNPPDNTGGNTDKPSRAVQLAQKYREEHYGKEDK